MTKTARADDAPPFTLSQEAQILKRSMMRELIAVTARPGIISFAGGLPAPECLPVRAWGECSAAVLAEDGPIALQYGPPYPPLQAAIARLMAARGVAVEPEQVFITSGCQQGLHIAGRLLMDPGSVAVVDQAVFPGVRQAFGGPAHLLRGVSSDVQRGLDMAELAAALRQEPRPRALVVVPDFHNPLGRSLDDAARDQVVALAREAGVALVEDDPYSLLRFEGRPPLPLLARAPERTFYLGSFSKLVAPALRAGWLIAPPGLTDKLRVIKESVDLETSALIQRTLARFLDGGYLDGHLALVRRTYQERCALMQEALAAHFPPGSRWTRPEGGMFIWAELPEGVDTLALLPSMVDQGVAYIPGAAFTPGGGARAMRLNFSNAAPDRIVAGIALLGEALRRVLGG
jgi:2-aminoadipate transaminase